MIFDVIDMSEGRTSSPTPACRFGVVFYGGYQKAGCGRAIVTNVAVAGSVGLGITLAGGGFCFPDGHFGGLTFHGVQHGFTVKGKVRDRDPNGVVRGFTAWNVRDIGIWGHNVATSR